MLNFIQIPDKLELNDVCYECDKITGEINKLYDRDKSWSYIFLWKTSKNFKINDFKSWATFSIRCPGRTLGHITVNGYGEIIESELYPKTSINKTFKSTKNTFKRLTSEHINLSVLAEIQFVQDNIKFCPEANKQILYFIANFIYHCGIDADEIIQEQFRAGYCLHFAMILKEMFPGGEICWCAPFGHMVYVYKDIPYDIEGINTSDCDHYIPISFIKEGIKDFMHIPGIGFNASEEYIQDAINRYNQYILHTTQPINIDYSEINKKSGDYLNG